MNTLRYARQTVALAGALAFFSFAGITATANAQTDEASLARGAQPDTTPQQRYQSAIREAGGGSRLACRNAKALKPLAGEAAKDKLGHATNRIWPKQGKCFATRRSGPSM